MGITSYVLQRRHDLSAMDTGARLRSGLSPRMRGEPPPQGNCIKLGQTHVRLPESGRGAPCGRPSRAIVASELRISTVGLPAVSLENRVRATPTSSATDTGARFNYFAISPYCPVRQYSGGHGVRAPPRPFVDKKRFSSRPFAPLRGQKRCSPCPFVPLRGQNGVKVFSVPLRGPPRIKRC